MVKAASGEHVVSESSFTRNKLKCDDQWIQVLLGGALSANTGYVVEYAYFGQGRPKLINITEPLSEFLDGAHDLKSMQLKCLPSEEKIGIYVPSQSDEMEALYIMVTKDGRVINGYNLSGHDQTAIDE